MSDENGGIRVCILDAFPIVRYGLRGILTSASAHIEVVAEADSVEAALKCLSSAKADVTVVGTLLNTDLMEAADSLRRIGATCIVGVFERSAMFMANAFLESGGVGCVSATSGPEEFVAAVSAVARGKKWISANLVELLDHYPAGWMHTDYFDEVDKQF